ncbi:Hypothetical protein SMAX5B_021657, partial [Scophthalmus maximus]
MLAGFTLDPANRNTASLGVPKTEQNPPAPPNPTISQPIYDQPCHFHSVDTDNESPKDSYSPLFTDIALAAVLLNPSSQCLQIPLFVGNVRSCPCVYPLRWYTEVLLAGILYLVDSDHLSKVSSEQSKGSLRALSVLLGSHCFKWNVERFAVPLVEEPDVNHSEDDATGQTNKAQKKPRISELYFLTDKIQMQLSNSATEFQPEIMYCCIKFWSKLKIVVRESESRISWGREFHSLGAALEKDLSPKLQSLVLGVERRPAEVDLRDRV